MEPLKRLVRFQATLHEGPMKPRDMAAARKNIKKNQNQSSVPFDFNRIKLKQPGK